MKKVSVIGMDMGDKNHKAVGLSEDGEVVDRAEVPCTPDDVRAYLKRHPGALLAIETGTHCRWVSRIGLELGHEVLVGNARKLRMIWDSSRKNDWNDAEKLAKVARMDRTMFAPVRLRGEDAALLDTITGVGPVTTAAFLAAVGDVSTFGSARDAGPYFGLVPRQDQSGETDKQLRISKEGNEIVRRLLVTAANYIMGPFGKDSDLRRHGMRIAERGGKNARKRAKVAVARKLAVVMLAVLKGRTAYRPLTDVETVA